MCLEHPAIVGLVGVPHVLHSPPNVTCRLVVEGLSAYAKPPACRWTGPEILFHFCYFDRIVDFRPQVPLPEIKYLLDSVSAKLDEAHRLRGIEFFELDKGMIEKT
jgi:hypothetical protein